MLDQRRWLVERQVARQNALLKVLSQTLILIPYLVWSSDSKTIYFDNLWM